MNTFLDIPLTIWAVISLGVAVIYYYVWPQPRRNTIPRPRWVTLLLRYGHSIVWILLSGVCLLWSNNAMEVAQILGLLALFLYAAFMMTMVW